MGAFSQLGLLLWRNFLQQKRQPLLLVLGVVWCVLLFLSVVFIRRSIDSTVHGTCHYKPRHLPSKGGVEFLQSFVCDMKNDCHDEEQTTPSVEQTRSAQLLSALAPLTHNVTDTIALSRDLPEMVQLIHKLEDTLRKPQVQQLLATDLTIGGLLTDTSDVYAILVVQEELLTDTAFSALLGATLNVSTLYAWLEGSSLTEVLCDADMLSEYLIFPAGSDVISVSGELCSLQTEEVMRTVQVIQDHVDVAAILDVLSSLTSLRGDYELSDALADVQSLVELMTSYMTSPTQLDDVIAMPEWAGEMMEFVKDMDMESVNNIEDVMEMMSDMKPMLLQMTDNSTQIVQMYDQMDKVQQLMDVMSVQEPKVVHVRDVLFYPDAVLDMMLIRRDIPAANIQQLYQLPVNVTVVETLLDDLESDTVTLEQAFCTAEQQLMYPLMSTQQYIAHQETISAVLQSMCYVIDAVPGAQKEYVKTIQANLRAADSNMLTSLLNNWGTVMNITRSMSDLLGEESVDGVLAMMDVLAEIDLQQVWRAVGHVGLVLAGDPEGDISEIMSGINSIQEGLMLLPEWNTINHVLMYQARVLNIQHTILNNLHNFTEMMNSTLEQEGMEQWITNVTESMQTMIDTATQHLMNATDDLGTIELDVVLSNVSEVCGIVEDLGLHEYRKLLCGQEMERLLNVLHQFLVESTVMEQITDFVDLFEYEDSGSEEELETMNITFIIEKTIEVMEDMDKLSALQHLSLFDILMSGSDDINDATNITTQKQLMDEMGKQMGANMNSMNTAELLPLIKLVYDHVDIINTLLDKLVISQAPLFSTTTEFGMLFDYVVNYGEEILLGVAQALRGSQRSTLLSHIANTTWLCETTELEELLQISDTEVPADDIRQLLCTMELSDVIKQAAGAIGITSITNHFGYLENFTMPAVTSKFSTENLTAEVEEMFAYLNKFGDLKANTTLVKIINSGEDMITAVEEILHELQNIADEDYPEVQAMVLQLYDSIMSDSPEWQHTKLYMVAVRDAVLVANEILGKNLTLRDIFSNSSLIWTDINTLRVFGEDSTEMLSMTTINMDELMEIIMQLLDDMSDPSTLLDRLCDDEMLLVDLLVIPHQVSALHNSTAPTDNTTAEMLADELCKINTTLLIHDLLESPLVIKMMKALEPLLSSENSSIPTGTISIDWYEYTDDMYTAVPELLEHLTGNLMSAEAGDDPTVSSLLEMLEQLDMGAGAMDEFDWENMLSNLNRLAELLDDIELDGNLTMNELLMHIFEESPQNVTSITDVIEHFMGMVFDTGSNKTAGEMDGLDQMLRGLLMFGMKNLGDADDMSDNQDIDEVVQLMIDLATGAGSMDITDPTQYPSLMDHLMNAAEMYIDLSQIRQWMSVCSYYYQVITVHIMQLPNEPTELTSLFPNATEVNKLFTALQYFPQIIDVVVHSSNTPQFQALLGMNMTSAMNALCGPVSDAASYLTIPDHVQYERVREEFCLLDVDLLQQEIMSITADYDQLRNVSSRTTFSELIEQQTLMMDVIANWTNSGGSLVFDNNLTNGTLWNSILTTWSQMQTDPSRQMQVLLEQLNGFNLTASNMSDPAAAVSQLLDMIKGYLNDVMEDPSLQDLLDQFPQIRDVLNTTLSDTDMITELIEELMSGSNMSDIGHLLKDNPLTEELEQLQQLIADVSDALNVDVVELFDVIVELESVLAEAQNTSRVVDLLHAVLKHVMPESLQLQIKQALELEEAISEFLTAAMSENRTIEDTLEQFKSLLNDTQLLDMLNSTGLLDVLEELGFEYEMVQELLAMSDGEFNMCNSTDMQQYLNDLPNGDINIEQVTDLLCRLNLTTLWNVEDVSEISGVIEQILFPLWQMDDMSLSAFTMKLEQFLPQLTDILDVYNIDMIDVHELLNNLNVTTVDSPEDVIYILKKMTEAVLSEAQILNTTNTQDMVDLVFRSLHEQFQDFGVSNATAHSLLQPLMDLLNHNATSDITLLIQSLMDRGSISDSDISVDTLMDLMDTVVFGEMYAMLENITLSMPMDLLDKLEKEAPELKFLLSLPRHFLKSLHGNDTDFSLKDIADEMQTMIEEMIRNMFHPSGNYSSSFNIDDILHKLMDFTQSANVTMKFEDMLHHLVNVDIGETLDEITSIFKLILNAENRENMTLHDVLTNTTHIRELLDNVLSNELFDSIFNGTLSVKKEYNTMTLEELLGELKALLSAEKHNCTHEGNCSHALDEVWGMLDQVSDVLQDIINVTSLEHIPHVLERHGLYSAGDICNTTYNTGGAMQYLYAEPYLDLFEEVMEKFMEMSDSMFCDMENASLSSMMKSLDSEHWSNLTGRLGKPVDANTFSCDSYGAKQSRLNAMFSEMFMTEEEEDMQMSCLKSSMDHMESLTEITNFFDMASRMMRLMFDKDNMELLAPFMDMLDVLPRNTRWHSIVSVMNVSSLRDVFSDDVVDLLMTAMVNDQWISMFDKNNKHIRQVLCDPGLLASVMAYPLEINNDPIHTMVSVLCTEDIDAIIHALQQSMHTNSTAMQGKDDNGAELDMEWLESMLDMMKDLSDMAEPLVEAFKGLIQGDMEQVVPNIQRMMISIELSGDKLTDQLYNMTGFLFNTLGMSDEAEAIIDTAVNVTRGVMALKVINTFIPTTVYIRDIVDAAQMEDRLLNDVGLSEESVRTLMDAGLSHIKLYELQKMIGLDDDTFCDDGHTLDTILIHSDEVTQQSKARLHTELCDMSAEQLTTVVDTILKGLTLDDLIDKIIAFEEMDVLQILNITEEEFKSLVETAKPLQETFGEVLKQAENITMDVNFMDLLDPKTATMELRNTLDAMSEVICGTVDAFDITDEFKLGGAESGRLPDNLDEEMGNLFDEQGHAKSTKDNGEQRSDVEKEDLEVFKDHRFCLNMYLELQSSKSGKIIWNFLKPLMQGAVLYAPSTPLTDRIMREAWWLFDGVSSIHTIAEAFAQQSDGFFRMANSTFDMELFKILQDNPLVSPMLSSMLGVSTDQLVDQIQLMNDMEYSDAQQIEALARLVHNVTECVNFSLQGLETEEMLEEHARDLADRNRLLASVVFLDMDKDANRQKRHTHADIPEHVRYKIRLDKFSTPPTNRIKSLVWFPGPEDSFAEDLQYFQTFIPMQDLLDKAIIKMQIEAQKTEETVVPTIPNVAMHQMPYPCWKEDAFHMVTSYGIPLILALCWIPLIASAVAYLTSYRARGQEEGLRVMGVGGGVTWVSWFFSSMLHMIAIVIIMLLFIKLGDLLPHSNTLIIILSLVNFCFATSMMAYLVGAFFTRTTIAAMTALFVYLISYLPYIIIIINEHNMKFWHRVIVCLSSTTAFSYSYQFVTLYENRGDGIQWSNTKDGWDEFDFRWATAMVFLDGVLYALLGLYVRTVLPRKYGTSKPWYHPLTPWNWSCCSTSETSKEPVKHNTQDICVNTDDEHENGNASAGLVLHHVTKRHNNQKSSASAAVQDLSATVYADQVTVLLGQNGAGKSTLISILTGIQTADEGSVVMGDGPAHKHARAHSMMGYCPQHDMLFEHMTVKEHFKFFAKLKKANRGQEQQRELASLVDLTHKMNTPVKHLSGGQRRRLQVALAFIGDAQVIVLDEPTSGVDPVARRCIWNLIMQKKKGKTILLSTHHLDETDVLADRVLIMHKGRVICKGTPLSLKKQLGSGYQLHVTSLPSATTSHHTQLLALLQTYVPQVYTDNTNSSASATHETTYIIPESSDPQQFSAMFEALEAQKDALCVSAYGLTDGSLEEVFLKVTGIADRNSHQLKSLTLSDWQKLRTETCTDEKENKKETTETDVNASRHDQTDNAASLDGTNNYRGATLRRRQMKAMIIKRFHHCRRNARLYISQLILPCLFVAVAMVVSIIKPTTDDMESLQLAPPVYKETAEFYSMHNPSAMDKTMLETYLAHHGEGTACYQGSQYHHNCVHDTAHVTHPGSHLFSESHPDVTSTGCSCDGDGLMSCSESRVLDAPLLEYELPSGMQMYDLSNYPLSVSDYLVRTYREFVRNRYGGFSFNDASLTDDNVTVWFNNKGWHSAPSYFNMMSNMVLRANLIHHTAANVTRANQYGITTYNHPLKLNRQQLGRFTLLQGISDTGIALTILLAFCFVPAGYILYVITERITQQRRLQQLCGVDSLLYWTTTFFWDMLMYILTIALAVAIMAAFQVDVYTAKLNLPAVVVVLLLFGASSIPLTYVLARFFTNINSGYISIFVLHMLIGVSTTITTFQLSLFSYRQDVSNALDIMSKVFLIFPQFCFGDAFIRIARNHLIAEVYERFDIEEYENPFSLQMIGWHLIAMAIQAVVFLMLLCVSDKKIIRRVERVDPSHPDYRAEDEDVSHERIRVMSRDGVEDDVIRIERITKQYYRGNSRLVAVDDLCLGVKKGECFGLLGHNGAGKTTTFKMLTGQVRPSHGEVMLDGKTLSEGLDQNVGYCPQNDPLDDMLTGEELMYYMCRMRGIREGCIPKICFSLTSSLGLTDLIHKKTSTYSGGNKRKLSVALALIADPHLVLMDEPTTGMDPRSRRKVWSIIQQVIKMGRSVIFTSHSMDECDTLCSRLSVMVNGKLQCLGSGQDLKHRYGKGYILKIRVEADCSTENVKLFVKERVGNSTLKSEHGHTLTYNLSGDSSQLSGIFRMMEAQKNQLRIAQYSLAQCSLEQVFLSFASAQSDGTVVPEGDENAGFSGDDLHFSNLGDPDVHKTGIRSSFDSLKRKTSRDVAQKENDYSKPPTLDAEWTSEEPTFVMKL